MNAGMNQVLVAYVLAYYVTISFIIGSDFDVFTMREADHRIVVDRFLFSYIFAAPKRKNADRMYSSLRGSG